MADGETIVFRRSSQVIHMLSGSAGVRSAVYRAGGNVLMPYITHDIGGFIWKRELRSYARWLQFGVFSPFLRLILTSRIQKKENARMPWTYGDKG